MSVLPTLPAAPQRPIRFKFWELDYAAMDFTPNGQVTTTFVQPTSALDLEKTNALALLENAE